MRRRRKSKLASFLWWLAGNVKQELQKRVEVLEEQERSRKLREGSIDVEYKVIK